jgi:pyruvate formate lyase activating enzyme
VEDLASWVLRELGPEVPLHFTAFHPDWKMRDRPRTQSGTLSRARRRALDVGLRYVYTGNVHDPEGQSTRCHACRRVVVGRDGYHLTEWGLGAGAACSACGATCAGVFEGEPGRWGGGRMPVRIGRGG